MPQMDTKHAAANAFTPDEILAAEEESNQCGDRFTTEQVLEAPPSADKRSEGDFQVLWLPGARSQLKQLLASGDLASHVQDMENRLKSAPAEIGCEVGANHSRVFCTGSLMVLFRIDEADRLSTIMAVKKNA